LTRWKSNSRTQFKRNKKCHILPKCPEVIWANLLCESQLCPFFALGLHGSFIALSVSLVNRGVVVLNGAGGFVEIKMEFFAWFCGRVFN
jgi:hypothetical protein